MESQITEADIRRLAGDGGVLQRGREYWKRGRVQSFKLRGNIVEAKVRGSSNYTVTIKTRIKSEKDVACTCPYEWGVCKHIVAVLYTLMHQYPQKKQTNTKKQSLLKMLKLEDAIRNASIQEILKARELISTGKVQIMEEDNESAFLVIEENEEKEQVNVEAQHIGNGTMRPTFWKECSCMKDSFHNPCAHRIAALFTLLKKHCPREIPPNFEEKLKKEYQAAKYRVFLEGLAKAQKPEDIQQKTQQRPFKILLTCFPEEERVRISVVKVQVRKDGTLGIPREVDVMSIQQYYEKCADDLQRILDYLLNPFLRASRHEAHFYGYSYGQAIEKRKNQDTKPLQILRDCYQKHPEYFINVSFPQEKGTCQIEIVEEKEKYKENRYKWRLSIHLSGKEYNLTDENIKLVGDKELWAGIPIETENVSFPRTLLVEIDTINGDLIQFLRKQQDMEMNKNQLTQMIGQYYPALSSLGNLTLPGVYKPQEQTGILPKLRLFIREKEGSLVVDPHFLYLDQEIGAYQKKDIVYQKEDNLLVKIMRNSDEEQRLLSLLETEAELHQGMYLLKGDPLEWLADNAPRLIAQGCELFGSDKLLNAPISSAQPKLNLSISSGIDWFDIKGEVTFGKEKIPFADVLQTISNHERWVKLADGSIGAIPKQWLEKIAGTLNFLEQGKKDKTVRAARTQLRIVESLAEIAETKTVDDAYKEMRDKFEKFENIQEMPPPKGLQGELRKYQKAGYNWLHFLREFSFGGCLADEMGLGKTVQVLALLLYEKEQKGKLPLSLIVAPTSLLFNWQQEINKFTPSLIAIVHHGQERKKDFNDFQKENVDLIITSYDTLRNDEVIFTQQPFHYVVLDESQKIKNPITKNARTINKLQAKNRLILTGTPIENNYLDLWSQFAFLNPGLLGSHEQFKDSFSVTTEKEKMSKRIKMLRTLINPFILMRKKETVAKDLPEKQIEVVYCNMGKQQETVYNSWKEKFRKEIKETIEEQGLSKSKIKILEGLMRLRQICNHPKLVDESYTGESAKFTTLIEYLKETLQVGRKALVFSSFVKMLHLIKIELEKEKIPFAYLDGSTQDRESVVREFQTNSETKFFLGSLKAGGLGLNLTAAEQVFIVDPWWNPASEMQAIDRAHRIGQSKPVFVYKLIVKDTIEEKILVLQQSKQKLVQEVMLQEENIFKQLNKEEILHLFV